MRREPPRGGPLDRALGLFADVRAGEGGAALLMLGNLFLLLVAYYILKTVREPLILATGGAAGKTYASAVQALALMAFVPAYGWVAARSDRSHLVTWVLLFFIANVELFNLGLRVGVAGLGFVFFVWVGIFSLAVIAQFWSYANDVYRREDGERLFPLIAIGATAGSPVGARAAQLLFGAGVSPANMLHVAAVLLLLHLALFHLINGRLHPAGAPATPKLAGPSGFALVFQSRYLGLIAVLLILLNIVNTIGEYIVSSSALAAADAAAAATPGLDRQSFIGAYYGSYFLWVNVIAVALQSFVAARLVRLRGLAGVLLALPVVSLGAYGLIGLGVGLTLVRWAKTAENATDYSIMNTARQMLWLPTSREEKYKAKQALDTFFVRTGDMLAAGVVYAGTRWLGFGMRGFAWANVALVAVWLVVAFRLLAENRALIGEAAGGPSPDTPQAPSPSPMPEAAAG